MSMNTMMDPKIWDAMIGGVKAGDLKATADVLNYLKEERDHHEYSGKWTPALPKIANANRSSWALGATSPLPALTLNRGPAYNS